MMVYLTRRVYVCVCVCILRGKSYCALLRLATSSHALLRSVGNRVHSGCGVVVEARRPRRVALSRTCPKLQRSVGHHDIGGVKQSWRPPRPPCCGVGEEAFLLDCRPKCMGGTPLPEDRPYTNFGNHGSAMYPQ